MYGTTKLITCIWLFVCEKYILQSERRWRGGALAAGVESAGDNVEGEEWRRREGRAVMNNSPLCALLLLLIFAYAQGNDSAVQLRAPPSADLHSARPNRPSIL